MSRGTDLLTLPMPQNSFFHKSFLNNPRVAYSTPALKELCVPTPASVSSSLSLCLSSLCPCPFLSLSSSLPPSILSYHLWLYNNFSLTFIFCSQWISLFQTDRLWMTLVTRLSEGLVPQAKTNKKDCFFQDIPIFLYWYGAHEEVRRQLPGVSFLFLPCESQGSNLCHQA